MKLRPAWFGTPVGYYAALVLVSVTGWKPLPRLGLFTLVNVAFLLFGGSRIVRVVEGERWTPVRTVAILTLAVALFRGLGLGLTALLQNSDHPFANLKMAGIETAIGALMGALIGLFTVFLLRREGGLAK